jgi:putative ubiquitin-RnfH superfamily antitoxin RatB of RatAB toxin-antitoxin module
MTKRCSVVCDTPAGVRECELLLQGDATVADALSAARGLLAIEDIDWARCPVGIFGELCVRERIVADRDRIELYRVLATDPRAARRARAARAGARSLSRRRGT